MHLNELINKNLAAARLLLKHEVYWNVTHKERWMGDYKKHKTIPQNNFKNTSIAITEILNNITVPKNGEIVEKSLHIDNSGLILNPHISFSLLTRSD